LPPVAPSPVYVLTYWPSYPNYHLVNQNLEKRWEQEVFERTQELTGHLPHQARAGREVDKTLVVAPLRVCHSVWPVEIEKHGFDLTISVVHGPENKRIKQLGSDADIYVTTPGLIPWLQPLSYEFDLLICDESTKFKGWGTRPLVTLPRQTQSPLPTARRFSKSVTSSRSIR
jgi:hypothetical protein